MPEMSTDDLPTLPYEPMRYAQAVSEPHTPWEKLVQMGMEDMVREYKELSRRPQARYEIQHGALVDSEDSVPIDQCPDNAVRAVEYVRAGVDVMGEVFQESVFAVYDKKGRPLGSFLLNPGEERLALVPSDIALATQGVTFLEPVTARDIDEYLARFEQVFGPESACARETGLQLARDLFPPDALLPLMRIIDRFPDQRTSIYALLKDHKEQAIPLILSVVTQEDLDSLCAFGRSIDPKMQVQFGKLKRVVTDVFVNAETIPAESAYIGKKLQHHMVGLSRGMVRVVLRGWQRDDFHWAATQESFKAFDAMFRKLYGLPTLPPRNNTTLLSDYMKDKLDEPNSVDLVLPAMADTWLTFAGRFAKDEFQKKSGVFYDAVAEYLDEHASELTGDTPVEIDRNVAIFTQLVEKEYVPSEGAILDAGCGRGRVLRPVLDRLRQDGTLNPACVVDVDLQNLPQPGDGRWEYIQADFSSPRFAKKMKKKGVKPNMVLSTWSPLADVSPEGQQTALNNFSSLGAKIVVADVPAGYALDAELYHQEHPDQPLGVIEREFNGIKKPFTIPQVHEFLARIKLAGYRVINAPGGPIDAVPAFWTTRNGHKRWTMVLEKVREPQESLDQLFTQLLSRGGVLVGSSA